MCRFNVHENDSKSDDIDTAAPWEQHVTSQHDIWPTIKKKSHVVAKFTPTKVPECMATTKPFSQLISHDGLQRNQLVCRSTSEICSIAF